MRPLFRVALGILALSGAAALASPADVSSLEELLSYHQRDLDALYMASQPGEIPRGDSHGKAMFFPGTLLGKWTTRLASVFWQGKVFDLDGKALVNKVLGFNAIKAQVFFGKSWYDGHESIIIDYADTSLLAFAIRDEIREIAPKLYLGRAYVRTPFGPVLGVNFALDFRQ